MGDTHEPVSTDTAPGARTETSCTPRTADAPSPGSLESRYHALLDTLPVGVFRSLPDGTFLEANEHVVRMRGARSREEFLTTSATDLYADPADRQRLLRQLLEYGSIHDAVLRSRKCDGTVYWVSLTATLLRNGRGEIDSILGIVEDVSSRRAMLDALALSEERYRGVVKTSPDAIAISDLQGWFVEINPRFTDLFGFDDVDQMRRLGINSANLVLEPDLAKMRDTVQDLIGGNVSVGMEVRVKRKDGSVFPAEFSTSLLRDDLGEPAGFLAVIRDISERKRAEQAHLALEEQLRQSQKLEAIGLLAGGVAHDLNNMLTPILGNADLLLLDRTLNPLHRSGIEDMVKATKRARDLVRQLMAFGRKQTLDMKSLDVDEVVASFESLLRRTLRENVRIVLDLRSASRRVLADRGQIEQVLLNLALNSQDAMPREGTLTVRTSTVLVDASDSLAAAPIPPGTYVALSVSDTGCGMDPITQQRIFEPFFTTKEKGKGTGLGLGLATVYGIVRQHGGDIRVQTVIGQGSTFEVLLPASSTTPPIAPATPSEPKVHAGRETILVAEDDPAVRHTTVALLERLGYRVLSASSIDESLAIARTQGERVDLLLTDVVMPEVTGKDLYAKLQALIPGLKVIYMSGYASDVIEGHGALAQGTAFLQKPFTLQALSDRVRGVLDS